MNFNVKQYLETLLQPYPIISRSCCLFPIFFQILYAINQTSWKDIHQNLTKKTSFLITLVFGKSWYEILHFDRHNVKLSMDPWII